MRWAYAYPVAAPALWYPPAWVDDPQADATPRQVAEETADDVAARAGLEDVIAVGDVGDLAAAIIRAAHANQVDVVVIGSHDRAGSVVCSLARSRVICCGRPTSRFSW